MAISYLASSASSALGPATSLTYAIDCTGSDFLIVGCSYNGSGSITSVTYNGTAMTQAVSDSHTPGSNTSFSAIYYLYAPSTGSNNVVVTFNSSPSSRIRSAAACYSGVDTSGQPDATQKNYTASGTTLSCTTSTVAANNYVVTYSTGVDTSR